ncbi:hypothetical protein HZY93_00565 [Streptococcus danieliae]|uniref:Uncharacterized protein n=1 Tax=Streptococcus danieliae TaxID=747656 RepID=A0A7Z0LBU9_9STRE|nr:hypothetical protein [Streptococcus danieliae]MBF0716559.1 hypothetical protein [Streptococcus danieliae]MCU0082113.1 hypothetical protein [Streptococcus danieliae]NYS48489.1 hypothetical protein [Streptococcus danieliae]
MVLGDWTATLDRALEQLNQGDVEIFFSVEDWERASEADVQPEMSKTSDNFRIILYKRRILLQEKLKRCIIKLPEG